MENKKDKICLFYYPDNRRAVLWADRIRAFIKKSRPDLRFEEKKPDLVIVLGGDGTILEAAREYHETGAVILGLNLGTVGFLASVRREQDFLKMLGRFFDDKYRMVERLMISARIIRKNRIIFKTESLNDVVVKNPLGMVELVAKVAGHPVKHIRGTGILISTATGSTAYNLSAHGPIVVPEIKCLIITELLDHSIPSPSVVVKSADTVSVKVVSFRRRELLSLSKTGKKIDVLLAADGESVFPLEEKDEIVITSSPHLVKFAEFEKHYFFKSLKKQFGYK